MSGIAIERILSKGNLDLPNHLFNSDSLLEFADALMNESQIANNELGQIFFEADGKYYTVVPSTTLVEVDEEVVKEKMGWRYFLRIGDEVYWNDPDGGKTSRYITIQTIEYNLVGPSTARITTKEGDVIECLLNELS